MRKTRHIDCFMQLHHIYSKHTPIDTTDIVSIHRFTGAARPSVSGRCAQHQDVRIATTPNLDCHPLQSYTPDVRIVSATYHHMPSTNHTQIHITYPHTFTTRKNLQDMLQYLCANNAIIFCIRFTEDKFTSFHCLSHIYTQTHLRARAIIVERLTKHSHDTYTNMR